MAFARSADGTRIRGANRTGDSHHETVAFVDHASGAPFALLNVDDEGGASVTRELISRFQAKGAGIRQSCGCTECCGGATMPPLEEATRNPNSCGKAMLGLSLKVCDDEGTPCPPNTPGEICFTGPQMKSGYWNNAKKKDEVFDGDWYLTGDIGFVNDDGSVIAVDRKKNMIITGA